MKMQHNIYAIHYKQHQLNCIGILQPKMKIVIIDIIDPKLFQTFEFLSYVERKWRYFEERW